MRDHQKVAMVDHGSTDEFYQYYASASQSKETAERFASIQEVALRLHLEWNAGKMGMLEVADIGCGAGTQCLMWGSRGHRVHGLDINEPLLNLARKRAAESEVEIDFRLGTATKLPWADEAMDICLVPELLEHVAEWEPCLVECARVLKPGGVLFVTTTNRLCPKQQEFALPMYSWYPTVLKRYCERLAVTTHTHWVNHAKYPAVHWFTFYQLRAFLSKFGLTSLDRFDAMDLSRKGRLEQILVPLIRRIGLVRFAAHVCTPSLILFAIKRRPVVASHPEPNAGGS